MADRRIRTAIHTEFEAGPVSGSGHIKNLGFGGLFVSTEEIPERGDPIKLRFRLPGGDSVWLSGLVWWTTNDRSHTGGRWSGFGLRVLERNDHYANVVTSLLG